MEISLCSCQLSAPLLANSNGRNLTSNYSKTHSMWPSAMFWLSETLTNCVKIRVLKPVLNTGKLSPSFKVKLANVTCGNLMLC